MSRVEHKLGEGFDSVLDLLITLLEILGKVRCIFPSGSIAHDLDKLLELSKELVVTQGCKLRLGEMSGVVLAVSHRVEVADLLFVKLDLEVKLRFHSPVQVSAQMLEGRHISVGKIS